MRLVLNLHNLIPPFSEDQAAKLTAQAGFDATDYFLQPMNDPTCIFNSDQWFDTACSCNRIFTENNVPIVQTHAPYTFKGWTDPVTFDEFIYPTLVRSIKVSAVMGAKCVVVHPLHYWKYAGNEQEIFERNMNFYRSLIPICEEYNIKVGIENMFQRDKLRGNYIIRDACSDVTEFCRYIDTLDSEYMVACLDIGHVGLPSGNPDAWEFIRILGRDRLQALHVHDNDFTNDQHLIPYCGKIDWEEVAKALGEIDYSGDFTYECIIGNSVRGMTPEIYPLALSYVEKIGRHLIASIDANRPGVYNN